MFYVCCDGALCVRLQDMFVYRSYRRTQFFQNSLPVAGWSAREPRDDRAHARAQDQLMHNSK